MSTPPAKRQRTENAVVTRSDIWYDGSVGRLLQAQNTQFRVHWGVLAQHSSFFCNMKGLPQPPDQPTIEGCPIVEPSDAATDLDHQQALPLPVIAAFYLIRAQVRFCDLLNGAVERLTFENSSTLEEYDARLVDIDRHNYLSTRIKPYYLGMLFDIATLLERMS
ncbi:hypothetical protein C8R43DRAFT_1164093 [Mycena crocata]|nr:hypothetical protein C8R43DRAFT_1164093 [Mycena crocata]